MTLGRRIAQLRKEQNMTQQELANILEVSREAVSMWEIGLRQPNLDTLQKLADFFGCSVDYLLGRTSQCTSNTNPIGRRIAQLRKKRNITQEELANILEVSREAVSMWEIGLRQPNLDTLQKLADFFGCSVDYLLGRTSQCKCTNNTERNTDPVKKFWDWLM